MRNNEDMIDNNNVDLLLDRFRQWLQQARADAEALDQQGPDSTLGDADGEEVGLYALIEEFTAVRQELKLQTKSTRGLQGQAELLLPALQQAIDQFRAVEPKEAQAAWTAGKSLAESLAVLDEALDRGRDELEKARHRLVEEPGQALASALDDLYARRGWLWRRLVRSYHERALELVRGQGLEARRGLFAALLEGYALIQSRLRRALTAEQIERIDCLGRPVDPDLMIVIEAVDDSDQPPGHVVGELRRGYTWRGRVLRFAEVRASRSPSPSWTFQPDEA
ncbi:MAG: nucleotide exchange factor GrpE [Isosphaeraceae bacterium]